MVRKKKKLSRIVKGKLENHVEQGSHGIGLASRSKEVEKEGPTREKDWRRPPENHCSEGGGTYH